MRGLPLFAVGLIFVGFIWVSASHMSPERLMGPPELIRKAGWGWTVLGGALFLVYLLATFA